jgi:hypothetical protein
MSDNAWSVQVHNEGNSFAQYQRQNVTDAEVDYGELVVTAQAPDGAFTANYQHFDDNALAHTRFSLRNGPDSDYILVEELQSDLVQQGWQKPTNIVQFETFGEFAVFTHVLPERGDTVRDNTNLVVNDILYDDEDWFPEPEQRNISSEEQKARLAAMEQLRDVPLSGLSNAAGNTVTRFGTDLPEPIQ